MLLIALTFAYITFTTINFGACVNAFFKIRTSDFAMVAIQGLFGITMFTTCWAIFGRIHWEFHVALLALNLVLFGVFRNAVTACYRMLRIRFSKLPMSLKVFLFFTILLILAKSASAPFVLDNESYYIQTIKWLNEYGMVKGLANLHVFFAQMSGWHIAQSAFSFSFLYPHFNDLSGYCLILSSLYAVFRLDDFSHTGSKIALTMGLLPITGAFLLQFCGAPSPDIPILVLSFLALDVFLNRNINETRGSFALLAILVLFALFIKITSVALVILPLYVLVKERNVVSKRLFLASAVVLGLFCIRNAITSGLPLFPLPFDFGLQSVHAMPNAVASYFFAESRPFAYGLTKAEFEVMPLHEILWSWMHQPKLHGLFNIIAVLLVLIVPFFIRRFFHKKSMWIAYFAMAVQLCLLLLLSPQYRFFMNFILFFGLFMISCLVNANRNVFILLVMGSVTSFIVVFIPLQLNSVTNNELIGKTTAFSLNQVFFPHPNTRSEQTFIAVKNGNLRYNSPVNSDFFWKTSNGPLPCVNKQQVDFFEINFRIRPQLRNGNLADGFVSDTVR